MCPNDTNEILITRQLEIAHQVQADIFRKPAERYLQAAQLLQIEDELTKGIREIFLGNRAVKTWRLSEVYIHLAAYHRIKTDPVGQLPLPYEDQTTYIQQFTIDWLDNFQGLLSQMVEQPEIARALITMIVFDEEDYGRADNAHRTVRGYLKENFPLERKVDEQMSLPKSSPLGKE